MDINIGITNEYDEWNADSDWVKKTAKALMEYLLTQPEIADNCCLKNYDYETGLKAIA